MFWESTYSVSPRIEDLLTKEDITLKELLDDDEILQEYKSQNKSLIQFFQRKDVIEELITLITTEPPTDVPDVVRFKHPNIACEILTMESPSLTERLIENETILQKLYSFLEQEPPLNPLLTSFFSKTFGMLIVKKSEQDWFSYQCVCVQVLEFIKTRDRFLETLFKHIGTPAIMDLLFQILVNVEGPDLKNNLFDWLKQHKLIPRLINILGCGMESDKHLNVSQFICNIITHSRTFRQNDLVERGSNKLPEDASLSLLHALENAEITRGLMDIILLNSTKESTVVAAIRIIMKLLEPPVINERDARIVQLVMEAEENHRKILLGHILPQVSARIKDFNNMLVNPPQKPDIQNTVTVLSPPFGNTRLQICGMFSVLLKTDNLELEKSICESDIFNTLLKLFKQYCWNNLLHNQVKICLIHALTPRNSDNATSDFPISALQKHIILNCKIVSKLIDCWMHNNEIFQLSKKKGSRLGYMGQLIAIFEVLTTFCRQNDEYRALVESSLTDAEMTHWKLITNDDDGELKAELALQNMFLAGLDPYEKNDDDFNTTAIIDESVTMDVDVSARFEEACKNKEISVSSLEHILSDMLNSDDADLSVDDFDQHIDNDFEANFDAQHNDYGDHLFGSMYHHHHNNDHSNHVILEASDDNANVRQVDKLKDMDSFFNNMYNTYGDSQSGIDGAGFDIESRMFSDDNIFCSKVLATSDEMKTKPAGTINATETIAINNDKSSDVPFNIERNATGDCNNVDGTAITTIECSDNAASSLPAKNGPTDVNDPFLDKTTATTTPNDLKFFSSDTNATSNNTATTTIANLNHSLDSHENGPV